MTILIVERLGFLSDRARGVVTGTGNLREPTPAIAVVDNAERETPMHTTRNDEKNQGVHCVPLPTKGAELTDTLPSAVRL